ncbi:short-chain dehydrogenase [Neobacillus drentensis]|uniref:short-chain dehydrogenase n=1 Tax=Neobacillus drentensis TaxID=220684 RepID=UPI00300302D5
MKHALVIGGTGMLASVSMWLVNDGFHVSVIGRDPVRMSRLVSKKPSMITPLLVDYRLDEELRKQLKESIKKHGEFNLVVAWVHSTGKNVFKVISDVLPDNAQHSRLFHILGSQANLGAIRDQVQLNENYLYRQVQLGFVMEENASRWLTNEEISAGVIESIKDDKLNHLVGVLEPHDARPH